MNTVKSLQSQVDEVLREAQEEVRRIYADRGNVG